MKILTSTQVRQNLQDVLDSVYYQENTVIVTKKNKPRVIIVPLPKDDKKIQKAIEEHAKARRAAK